MTLSLNLRLAIASHYSEQARSRWMQCSQVAWNDLAQEATVNRLAPLLYHSLTKFPRADVPDAVLDHLRTVYYATAARNMQMHEQLKRVTDALDKIGVRYILLKGAALIQDVYEGNMALRPMSDIDILVDSKDFPAALSQIETFAQRDGIMLLDENFISHHQGFLLPNNVTIELHSRLLNLAFYINKLQFDMLWWSRGNRVGFSPKHQFVHLCAHAFLHHQSIPHFGADAGFVYQQLKDKSGFLQIAYKNDLIQTVKRGLVQIQSQWFIEIPDELIVAINQAVPTYRERFYLFCAAKPSWLRFARWIAQPSISLRIRYIWYAMFPTKAYLHTHWPNLNLKQPRWKVYLQRFTWLLRQDRARRLLRSKHF